MKRSEDVRTEPGRAAGLALVLSLAIGVAMSMLLSLRWELSSQGQTQSSHVTTEAWLSAYEPVALSGSLEGVFLALGAIVLGLATAQIAGSSVPMAVRYSETNESEKTCTPERGDEARDLMRAFDQFVVMVKQDLLHVAEAVETVERTDGLTSLDSGEIDLRSRERTTQKIEAMLAGVRKVGESVQNLGTRMLALKPTSAQIDEIVQNIRTINQQDFLWALNAGVEAARAGEHDLAFTVITDEADELAERTIGLTEEISAVEDKYQQQAEEEVSATGGGRSAGDREMCFALQADEVLNTLVEISQVISDVSARVESATQKYRSPARQILRASNGGTMDPVQSDRGIEEFRSFLGRFYPVDPSADRESTTDQSVTLAQAILQRRKGSHSEFVLSGAPATDGTF